MPTTRRRLVITETPEVEEALDMLRERRGTARLDLKEVLVAGAKSLADERPPMSEHRRRELREAARWLLTPNPELAERIMRDREAAWGD